MAFEVVLENGSVYRFVEKQKLWRLQLSNMTICVVPKFNYERILAELFAVILFVWQLSTNQEIFMVRREKRGSNLHSISICDLDVHDLNPLL